MDAIGLSLVVLVCLLFGWQRLQVRRYKSKNRVVADKFFRDHSLYVTDAKLAFDGANAEVVDEKEVVEQMRGCIIAYSLTRIAKNKSGEYFWFHFRTDSPPILKHIDQSRARALLESKYVSPSSKRNDVVQS